jgi:hypothetical protein
LHHVSVSGFTQRACQALRQQFFDKSGVRNTSVLKKSLVYPAKKASARFTAAQLKRPAVLLQ